MRVLKTNIRVIHSIGGKIAFMWNKVEFHDKKWEQIKCCIDRVYAPFSLFFIGICIFLLLGIHMDLFPQDKV